MMKLILTPKLQRVCIGLLFVLAAFAGASEASAQRLALKTNTLQWVAMTPNLTLEARLSRRFSVQLGLGANPTKLTIADFKTTNYTVEPELRYWFNRPMARHFIALSATATSFSCQLRKWHYLGDAVGAGVSYGYALVLGSHWNMEAEVGVGLATISAKKYEGNEVPVNKNFTHIKPVPIRLGLSFAYLFK